MGIAAWLRGDTRRELRVSAQSEAFIPEQRVCARLVNPDRSYAAVRFGSTFGEAIASLSLASDELTGPVDGDDLALEGK